MKLKKLLSLCLALALISSILSPAVVTKASAAEIDPEAERYMKFIDYAPIVSTNPKDYKIYHSMSTGDSVNDLGYSLDSPMAIDEYLDTLLDVGITRVYWRGLQQAVQVNQLTVRPEGNVRMLFQVLMGDSMYWEGNNFDDPDTAEIETIDTYMVKAAHDRGIKVIGMTTLADFGAPGDSTLTKYPYAHYSFHWEHPEWSPVDEWGIMKQGGPVDFSYEEARKYVIDLTMEEVERAGYDGVIFISYSENHDLKYDDQFGYNDPAVEEFKRRYGVTPEQDNLWYKVSMDHWRKLRGEYLTQFLREMKEALVEYNPDAILALNVSASKPRQQEVWSKYYDSHVCNNMYMDYETYVQEGIVDALHIKGNTDFPTQIKMIEDMLWLCRGTDTEVVIQSSVVNLPAYNVYDYWTPYLQRGVAVENFYTGPNGPVANDHTIYQTGPDISDKIGTMSEESQFRYHVAQVAMGKETATVEQLTQWLRMKDSVTVPRMAMHALATYHTEAAAPLLKEALTYDEIGVRGAALKYLTLYNLVTPDMAQAIIDNVDKDNSMGTYWLSGPTLYTNASAYQDALWDAFIDPNSSLRTKVIAMEGRNGLALTEEQVAQLHEVVTGDAFATEYDDIYDTDHEKAIEASYKSYIRYYSMNLMYHAARCGSVSAKEHLIEYAESKDTVVSAVALDYVGDAAAGQFFNADQEARAVAALDRVFGSLSSKSDVTYDGDFKQWAYRPAGNSLLKLGDAGKAVMQKYYVGDDPELALYAFKCMYMPQDENNVTLMDYDEYKEAYSHLPRVLNSYKAVKLEQDFENTSVFNAFSNPASLTWNGDQNGVGGRWYFGGSQVKITDVNTRSGKQALLLTGDMEAYTGAVGWNQTVSDTGKDYRVSAWICHEGGTLNFSTASLDAGSTTGQQNQKNVPDIAEVYVQVQDDGKVSYYDNVNKKFVATGLTVPKNKWTQITIESLRSNELNMASVSVRPEGEVVETTACFTIVPQPGTMTVRMHHAGSGTTYADDVLWLLSAADASLLEEKVITLDSDSVAYDGTSHGLTAVTEPSGLNVEYTYKDSKGKTLEGEPVNVGVYTVIATVTNEGYHGVSATATLEIRPANTVISGTATATAVEFGQPLSKSVLDTENLVVTPYGGTTPLTGSFTWDAPNTYYTSSGMRTFTFTPDDSNYNPCKGSVLVNVTSDAYQEIPVLDQDFDDTEMFNANATTTYNAGDTNTVDGRWGTLYPKDAAAGAVIYNVEDIGGTGQAVKIKRPGADTPLNVYVNNGVSNTEDFTLTFRAYHAQNEMVLIKLDTGFVHIKQDGNIAVYNENETGWVNTGVALTQNTWTTVTIQSDRVNGTFSVAVQPDGGSITWGTTKGFLKDAGITSIIFACSPAGTASPYLDSVLLNKMVPVFGGNETIVETDILNQDFNNTEKFKPAPETSYAADDGGATWGTLYPKATGYGAAIHNVEDIDGDGQAVKITRQDTSYPLTALMSESVSNTEDFILSFRAYRAAGETVILDLPTGMVYIEPANGNIQVHKADGVSWNPTGVTLRENTWTTVIIQSDRENGSFSVGTSLDGKSITWGENTGILKDVAINRFNFMTNKNSTSPFIDDVRLAKLSVAVSDVLDYVVAVNPDASADVGETVNVQLNVISNTKTTYNTFRYELSYDADMLAYNGVTSGVTVDSRTPGKLIVTGSGVDKDISDIIELSFTAKKGGSTKVTLDKAYVADTEVADIESTKAVLITVNETAITVSGYAVTLPDDFVGAAGVAEGADYTFTAKNPNYDYTFTGSTMGGAAVAVTDNGDGTFTVKAVSGDLVIVSQKTPKSFRVTVEGNAKADITAGNTATYGVDYSFTVSMAANYDYSVNVTVDGKRYTPANSGNTYTIAGEDIVGDICITVEKADNQQLPSLSGNLTLNGTIAFNFLVPATVDVTDAVYVVTNTTTGKTCDYVVTRLSDGTTCISVSVMANRMTDEFRVEVLDKNGDPLTKEAQVSIRSYTHKVLDAYKDDETLCAMLIAMLDYGALAQLYANTNTNDLANRYITDAQRAVLTGYPWPEN